MRPCAERGGTGGNRTRCTLTARTRQGKMRGAMLSVPSPQIRRTDTLTVTERQQVRDLQRRAAADASGELVVDPGSRRQGLGTALVEAVLGEAPGARLWSHGRLPAAAALA